MNSTQSLLIAGFRNSRSTLKRYTRPNYWEGPPNSQEFLVSGAIAYPAVDVETQIISYNVPSGYVGRLRWLWITHIGGNPPDGTGQVIWRLRLNGAALNGFGNLQFQVGSSNGAAFGPGMAVSSVELAQGDILTATVTTTVAQVGGVTTAAQFHGWIVSAVAQGGMQ